MWPSAHRPTSLPCGYCRARFSKMAVKAKCFFWGQGLYRLSHRQMHLSPQCQRHFTVIPRVYLYIESMPAACGSSSSSVKSGHANPLPQWISTAAVVYYCDDNKSLIHSSSRVCQAEGSFTMGLHSEISNLQRHVESDSPRPSFRNLTLCPFTLVTAKW